MQRLGIPILFILLILLNSCSLEQRIAVNYQKNIPNTSLLIRTNNELFFNNSKVKINAELSDQQKLDLYDSAYANSSYIKYMDADYFLQQFGNNFRNSFESLGLKVFTEDSITSFINQENPKIIVEILQLEVEEYYSYFTDKTFEIIENNEKARSKKVDVSIIAMNEDTDYLLAEVPINVVSVNAWVSVSSVIDDSTQFNDLLFMTYELKDEVSGFFDYDYIKEIPFYTYDIDTVDVSDLWKIEVLPPKDFSKQLIEYFANELITYEVKQKTNKPRQWYWLLNPKTKRLLPTHRDYKYIILEKNDD
jgi:hypothetical protein